MASEFACTLEDVLALTPVAEAAWNDDGSWIGYLRTDDTDTDFAAVDVGTDPIDGTDVRLETGRFEPDASTESGEIAEFAWRPGYPDEAAVVDDGAVTVVSIDGSGTDRRRLSRTDAEHGSLAWGPDGDRLAYLRDRSVWIHDLTDGGVRSLGDEETVADIFYFGTPLEWDPTGRYLATLVEVRGETLGVVVFDTETDEIAYETRPDPGEPIMRAALTWADDAHLVYAEDALDGSRRTYRSVRIGRDESDGVDLVSETTDSILLPHEPVGSGTGRLAVLSARTGYRHVYAVDVERRRDAVGDERDPGFEGDGVTQVTDGEFEARGDAMDTPAWSDDGRRLAYVTNELDMGERQLYVATLDEDGTVTATDGFTDVAGNALYPAFHGTDRVVVLRSGTRSPSDVHVADLGTMGMARVTASHPDPDRLATFPEPEQIWFESTDGLEIDGYLYAPPDAEPGDERPAIVYVHGGPISQMRRGFRPGTGHIHAVNHHFVDEGYVVLELNFRSGIGRGQAFEDGIQHKVGVDEVDDCVRAAEVLREHELVGDTVGLWGGSYGGFLANILATKTDAYDCTVNIAGIWDWRTWDGWALDHGPTHWGPGEETFFHMRFGGPPDSDDPEVQERFEVGSPSTYVDSMETPILALHGIQDENVPISETDDLIVDLIEAEKEFRTQYYPDAEHGLRKRADWRDGIGRMLGFYETHLR